MDKIIFTGSTEKGKLVAAAAAKNLVPCILELGGKCPMIIDKSADLDFAAAKAATMGFFNSGQVCIRSDYVLVESSLVDSFVKKLQENLEKMYKEGDKNTLGTVINKFHLDRLCDLLENH